MRSAEMWIEAWRNFTSGASRSILLIGLLVLVGATPGMVDVLTTRQILDDASAFQGHGASIVVVTAKNQISGAACDALSHVSGVRSAGALRDAGSITSIGAPDNPVPVKEVTPSFVGVLDLPSAGDQPGLAVSAQVSHMLAISRRKPWSTSDGMRPIAGVFRYPEDGRATDLAFSALSVVAASTLFDQCWVNIWPYDDDTVALARTAVAGLPGGDKVDVSQLNPTLGVRFLGQARFHRRTTAQAPLVSLALAIAVGVLSLLPRRLELASVLHMGVSRRALLVQIAFEALIVVVVGGLLAETCIIWACRNSDSGAAADLLGIGGRSVIAAAVGMLAGTLLSFLFIREESFFKLFKDR